MPMRVERRCGEPMHPFWRGLKLCEGLSITSLSRFFAIAISLHLATDRSLLLSGKRLEAGGGTFVGAVSISRTVVLTAVRISRSVNGASRSTATAWRRESRSPLGR
jgi:hypothetical protein